MLCHRVRVFGCEAEISQIKIAATSQNTRSRHEEHFAPRKTSRSHINCENEAKKKEKLQRKEGFKMAAQAPRIVGLADWWVRGFADWRIGRFADSEIHTFSDSRIWQIKSLPNNWSR
jgi:hypothetical protein